jgi:microcystin-dependent protein
VNTYVGQIRMGGFTFAPVGFLACNGQLLPISQYEALFSLLGTTYGGDGVSTFALPDLRGRAPLHQGTGPGQPNYTLGQVSGTETVTLIGQQLPVHTHPAGAGGPVNTGNPSNALPGVTAGGNEFYAAAGGTLAPMAAGSCGPTGGNQPHDNMMPFLVINFFICTEGIFPPRT